MKLFGLELGKKQGGNAQSPGGEAKKKSSLDLKPKLKAGLKLLNHHEATVVALAVSLLLAATALRMLHYMDPPVDDTKVQENLSKVKRIRIDSKTTQRLTQLQESGTSTGTNLGGGRTNPFSE